MTEFPIERRTLLRTTGAGVFGTGVGTGIAGAVEGPDVGTERADAVKGTSGGDVTWEFETGEWVSSSPTVVGGTVYVGSADEHVYAINNGDKIWEFETNDRVFSSPTVVDATVFVGEGHWSTRSEAAEAESDDSMYAPSSVGKTDDVVADQTPRAVYAIDADTGEKQWEFMTQDSVQGSPTVADGTVYVGSFDSKIYALDADSGTKQWEFETSASVRSSPTVVNGAVFVGNDGGNVYALDAETGDVEWTYESGGGIIQEPTVSNETVFIGSSDNSVYALDAETGDIKWTYETGDSVNSSATVWGGGVFVGSDDGNVYALVAETGEEVWTYDTGYQVESSPTVADGTVFAATHTSYDNDTFGEVHALNASTGEEAWTYSTDAGFISSPTVVSGTVFIGCSNHSVYALDAGVTGASEGSRVNLGTLGHHYGWDGRDSGDASPPVDQAWEFGTDGAVYSSPTVVDGTLFVEGGDEYVYALDAGTGDVVWTHQTGQSAFSSPTVVDGTVFVGGADNSVYAFDKETGNVEWTHQTEGWIWSSPTVMDGTVFIGSNDDKVYALDAETGDVEWTQEIGDQWVSSPTVVDGTVFIPSYRDGIYALDTDTGDIEWSHETGDSSYVHSSPTVVDGSVFVGGPDGNVRALDTDTGDIEWTHQTGDSVSSSPTVVNGVVFVGSYDESVYALDAETGDIKWTHEIGGTVLSSPTVVDGTVFVGSGDFRIYALDGETGTEQWRFQTYGRVYSSPTVVDGTVFVGSYGGSVYALDAGIEGSSEGSRVRQQTLGHHDQIGIDLRSITPGETKQGEIDVGDPSGDRGYYEPVTFSGSEGQLVTITMQSANGDTYLKLYDPDGTLVAENDDGGSGLNSQIEDYELTQTGEYTIHATSYDEDATFEYELELAATGDAVFELSTLDQPTELGMSEDITGYVEIENTGSVPGTAEVVYITAAGSIGGSQFIYDTGITEVSLAPGDSTSATGQISSFEELEGSFDWAEFQPGDEVLTGFRVYDDFDADDRTIKAELFDSILISESQGIDLRSINFGETKQGEIDSGDPTGDRGYYEPVTFSGSEGQLVTVTMQSANGDTYLKLYDPDGTLVAENDDGGSGLNSQIEDYELTKTGEYTIYATSYDDSATFEYELSLEGSEGPVEKALDKFDTAAIKLFESEIEAQARLTAGLFDEFGQDFADSVVNYWGYKSGAIDDEAVDEELRAATDPMLTELDTDDTLEQSPEQYAGSMYSFFEELFAALDESDSHAELRQKAIDFFLSDYDGQMHELEVDGQTVSDLKDNLVADLGNQRNAIQNLLDNHDPPESVRSRIADELESAADESLAEASELITRVEDEVDDLRGDPEKKVSYELAMPDAQEPVLPDLQAELDGGSSDVGSNIALGGAGIGAGLLFAAKGVAGLAAKYGVGKLTLATFSLKGAVATALKLLSYCAKYLISKLVFLLKKLAARFMQKLKQKVVKNVRRWARTVVERQLVIGVGNVNAEITDVFVPDINEDDEIDKPVIPSYDGNIRDWLIGILPFLGEPALGREAGYVTIENTGTSRIVPKVNLDLKAHDKGWFSLPGYAQVNYEDGPLQWLEPGETRTVPFDYELAMDPFSKGQANIEVQDFFLTKEASFDSVEREFDVADTGGWFSGILSDGSVEQSGSVVEEYTVGQFSGQSDARNETQGATENNDPVRSTISVSYPTSHVDLHVYDQNGNHVGYDYEAEEIVVEIPNAEHSGRDLGSAGGEWVHLDEIQDTGYEVELVGPATEGDMTSSSSAAVSWGDTQDVNEGPIPSAVDTVPYEISVAEIPEQPAELGIPRASVLFGGEDATTTTGQLTIAETGGDTPITELSVAPSDLSHENTESTIDSSQITVSPNPVSIDAGESLLLDITTEIPAEQTTGTYSGAVTLDDGGEIEATVDTNVRVIPPVPALPGYDKPPQDLDGDGRYEDVDGNGTFDIFDVQALFTELESEAVQSNPAAFKFNDDNDPDDVSIIDVQGLFDRLDQT